MEDAPLKNSAALHRELARASTWPGQARDGGRAALHDGRVHAMRQHPEGELVLARERDRECKRQHSRFHRTYRTRVAVPWAMTAAVEADFLPAQAVLTRVTSMETEIDPNFSLTATLLHIDGRGSCGCNTESTYSSYVELTELPVELEMP